MSVTPSVGLEEELNDNILMGQEHEPVWGNTLSPRLRWGAADERLDLHADLAARLARYNGIEGLDANDSSARIDSQYMLERGRGGLGGSLVRDSSWQSELRQTGQILAERRRSLRVIDGLWEESLTEKLTLRGQYELSDVRYAEEGGGLFDYQTRTGSVDLAYALSERNNATARFHLLRYRSPSARIRSIEAGLQVGWTHFFSETLQGTVSLGARGIISDSSFRGTERKDHERGFLGELKMEKGFEAARWQGGLDRKVNPSGSGSLILVDHLFSAFERDISPTMTLSLTAHGYHNRTLRVGLPNSEVRAFNVEPSWRWRWTENWSMMVSYRYLWQREAGGSAADSNAVVWRLFYEGPTWVGGVEGMSEE
jgi:hypothetical protein